MAASLAEICHVYPTSGGQYHWSYVLAPVSFLFILLVEKVTNCLHIYSAPLCQFCCLDNRLVCRSRVVDLDCDGFQLSRYFNHGSYQSGQQRLQCGAVSSFPHLHRLRSGISRLEHLGTALSTLHQQILASLVLVGCRHNISRVSRDGVQAWLPECRLCVRKFHEPDWI